MEKQLPDNQVDQVVEILSRGGVIAYPTDTLYGIGCDVLNQKAIKKVFELKGRDFKKPLSIACADFKMIEQFATVSIKTKKIVKKLLPGPYTIILPKREVISDLVTAGSEMVGVRIPDHNLCLSIIRKFGRPIITTSANLSGEKSITKYDDIILPVDFIVRGKCKYNQPSTVIDAINKKILRKGAGLEKLEKNLL